MMSRLAERLGADATEELLVGPLRGDLLGADHLAAHARVVAREQRVAAVTKLMERRRADLRVLAHKREQTHNDEIAARLGQMRKAQAQAQQDQQDQDPP